MLNQPDCLVEGKFFDTLPIPSCLLLLESGGYLLGGVLTVFKVGKSLSGGGGTLVVCQTIFSSCCCNLRAILDVEKQFMVSMNCGRGMWPLPHISCYQCIKYISAWFLQSIPSQTSAHPHIVSYIVMSGGVGSVCMCELTILSLPLGLRFLTHHILIVDSAFYFSTKRNLGNFKMYINKLLL